MPCFGCLFAAGAAAFPRLGLLFLWLFTNMVGRAFHGDFFLPLLGLIFLPFTTLMYVFSYTPGYGIGAWGWFWVVLGFLLDLGSYTGSVYTNRARFAQYGR